MRRALQVSAVAALALAVAGAAPITAGPFVLQG
jgi:hypothetical protein